jgi:hypothetical protein
MGNSSSLSNLGGIGFVANDDWTKNNPIWIKPYNSAKNKIMLKVKPTEEV